MAALRSLACFSRSLRFSFTESFWPPFATSWAMDSVETAREKADDEMSGCCVRKVLAPLAPAVKRIFHVMLAY